MNSFIYFMRIFTIIFSLCLFPYFAFAQIFAPSECMKGAPDWIFKPPANSAFGSAKVIDDYNQAVEKATSNARDEIARMIKVTIRAKTFISATEDLNKNYENFSEKNESFSLQDAELILRGTRRKEIWRSGCNEVFVLVSVDNAINDKIQEAERYYDNITRNTGSDSQNIVISLKDGCDTDNSIACYKLGILFQTGNSVSKDMIQSKALYAKSCSLGYDKACSALIDLDISLNSYISDKLKNMLISCYKGSSSVCFDVSHIYYKGQDVPRNYQKAAYFSEKACNGGEMKGCFSFGVSYEKGQGVLQNYQKAASLYEKACNGGNMDGCYSLGTLYDKGQGVSQNDEKAANLYEKACNGRVMQGCNNLGTLYSNGQGVPQNDEKAIHLFEKACNGGNMQGCLHLGFLYEKGQGAPQNYQKAANLYEKVCNGGDRSGCNFLKVLKKNGI